MQVATVLGVDVMHWNPRVPLPFRPRRLFRWTKRLPAGRRVNNFGDLLGPIVVAQQAHALHASSRPPALPRARLAAVGSVVHMLDPGTCVWGAGVNGNHLELPLPESLNVRAVRGPLTRRYLMERGTQVPEVFGDPALLIDYSKWIRGSAVGGVVCIQNLNDPVPVSGDGGSLGARVVSPTSALQAVVSQIAGADLVVGSSLHAVIVAEALGIPARVVVSDSEPDFKYRDYYEGTGRSGVAFARTVQDAIRMGGVDAPPEIDTALAAAFPLDLWGADPDGESLTDGGHS